MNDTPPPPHPRKTDLLLVALLVAALAGFGIWRGLQAGGGNAVWYSPPDKLRPWAEVAYRDALAARTPAPLGAVTPTSITTRLTSAALTVDLGKPANNMAQLLPGEPAKPLGPYKVQVGTGTLELYALGMLGPDSLKHVGEELPIQFYNMSGQSISSTTLPRYTQTREMIDPYEHTPNLTALFKASDPGLDLLDFKIFDARTHAQLSGGGWSSSGRDMTVGAHLAAFVSRPVTLVLRLARRGPVIDVPLTTGTLVKTPQYALGVLAALTAPQSNGWGMGQNIEIRFDPTSKVHSFIGLLQVWPAWAVTAAQVEVIGSNGKALSGGSAGSSGNFKILNAMERHDRWSSGTLPAKSLRVRMPKDYFVATFDLPALPGLSTQPIKNLFDQKIPYAKLDRDWGLRDFIMKTAQINMNVWPNPAGASPIPSGPQEFRNATVGQVMDAYVAMCGGPAKVALDPVMLQANPYESWRDRVKEWMEAHGF